MTPTQFDALNSAIAASVAASREALAKIDAILARLTASGAVEPFNSDVSESEPSAGTEVPNEQETPCGYPPEPAPEGMRWKYVGHGLNIAPLCPWLNPPVWWYSSGGWVEEPQGTYQSMTTRFHYFTAVPLCPN
jgi:hypothetical protein